MKQIRTIEAFLAGELEGNDLEKFKSQLSNDSAFAGDVQLHKEINDSIRDDNVVRIRAAVRKLFRNNHKKHRKIKTYRRIAIYASAAAVALLIALNLLVTQKHHTEEIFGTYYEPYNPDITLRSTTLKRNSVQFAYKLYQDKEYGAAFQILTNYLQENEDDLTARFYYGMCALELEKNDIAIDALREVIETSNNSPFAEHASWYLGLTYIKLEKTDSARKYFNHIVEKSGYHANKASDILKSIEE